MNKQVTLDFKSEDKVRVNYPEKCPNCLKPIGEGEFIISKVSRFLGGIPGTTTKHLTLAVPVCDQCLATAEQQSPRQRRLANYVANARKWTGWALLAFLGGMIIAALITLLFVDSPAMWLSAPFILISVLGLVALIPLVVLMFVGPPILNAMDPPEARAMRKSIKEAFQIRSIDLTGFPGIGTGWQIGFQFKHSDYAESFREVNPADLTEANLIRANLAGANLRGDDLSKAILTEANLTGADLILANLSEADLSGANLSEAHLGGANLSEADLSRANLRKADLYDTDLSEANLSEADLSGAKYNKRTQWPDGFNPDLAGAVKKGGLFK